MIRALALIALTGCAYNPPRDSVGDASNDVDAADPMACGWSYQPANIPDVCALTFALGIDLAGISTYDTGSDLFGGRPTTVLVQPDGSEVRVVAVAGFVVQANSSLIVKGTRPLLIVVDSDARIDGALIATGTQAGAGPGSNDAIACASSIGTVGSSVVDSGGSGGGGGGFGAAGGAGGAAFAPGMTIVGGVGGGASGVDALVPLHGGCGGGDGGGVLLGPVGGVAGNAGGAIQISARLEVSVGTVGSVLAGGAGGRPGLRGGSGGGGGGSGGGIQLEGNLVGIAGAVCANGGGGASGGGGNNDGDPGDDGGCARAAGGTGGSEGTEAGNGGTGGATTTREGSMGFPDPGGDNDGGGGGGGAAGRVVIRNETGTTGTITPAPLSR